MASIKIHEGLKDHVPPRSVIQGGRLLAVALLSIFVERLLKGDHEHISLAELATSTASTVNEVENALDELFLAGAIMGAYPHAEAATVSPRKLCVTINREQGRLPEYQAPKKKDRFQTGEDEVVLAKAPGQPVILGKAEETEGGAHLDIFINRNPANPEDSANLEHPIQGNVFETLAEAWAFFDEFVGGQEALYSVVEWALGLPDAGPKEGDEDYDAFGDTQALLSPPSFLAFVAELEAEADEDDKTPYAVARDNGWLEHEGRTYLSDESGAVWPGLEVAVEITRDEILEGADEPAPGAAAPVVFSLTLSTGEEVECSYVARFRPGVDRFAFTGEAAEGQPWVQDVEEERLVASRLTIEQLALGYAETFRTQRDLAMADALAEPSGVG